MRQLFRAISAVLSLVAIALVSALITMRLAIHGTEVRVPALSGLTMAQAVHQLHAAGLQIGIDGHFYSSVKPAGTILTQSPAPGTLVRKSWRVRVTESLGPQKIAVPNVDGMDEGIATITIRRTGLQVGDTFGIPYPYAPQNTVIAQTPMANALGVQGPRISLLTAQPAAPAENASIMPDLTGESFTDAALAVVHAGFKLAPLQTTSVEAPVASGGVSSAVAPASSAVSNAAASPASSTTSAASPTRSGTVIAQSPVPGERILAGATIHLTVQP